MTKKRILYFKKPHQDGGERKRLWSQKRRKSKLKEWRKKCEVCGRGFNFRNQTTEYHFEQRKYCSKECRKIIIKKQLKNRNLYKLRFEILERDKFTCQYCGASPRKNPEVKLHIDHKLPNKLGGQFNKKNLITACSICNIGKGDGKYKSVLDL